MDKDFQGFLQAVKDLFALVFGAELPARATAFVSWLMVVAAVLFVLSHLLTFVTTGLKFWRRELRPLFTPSKVRRAVLRRARRRRVFAGVVLSRLNDLDSLEDWTDSHFAELEAEANVDVEADGERLLFSPIPLITRTRTGLWRERSLTKALQASTARLILLSGEPGSGKRRRPSSRRSSVRSARGRRIRSPRSHPPVRKSEGFQPNEEFPN